MLKLLSLLSKLAVFRPLVEKLITRAVAKHNPIVLDVPPPILPPAPVAAVEKGADGVGFGNASAVLDALCAHYDALYTRSALGDQSVVKLHFANGEVAVASAKTTPEAVALLLARFPLP